MKKFKKTLLLILAAIFLLSLCACGNSAKSEKYELSQNALTAEKDTVYAQTRKFTSKQKVATSSMVELYFNDKVGDVAIKNSATGKWWYALPEKYNQSGKYVPSTITAEVVLDGRIIELSSCVDKTGYVPVTSEKIENGVRAKYTLKCTVDGETVSFAVPVEYTLVDGNFYANINCQNIENNSTVDGAVMTKIRLLNFFGASSSPSEDEYLLVPDNCGGMLQTSKVSDKFTDMSLKIYGDTENNNALFGVFGIKKSTDAFVCLIRKGDAIATVNAGTYKSETKYNAVGAQFDITETQITTKKDKSYIYVSGKTYSGELELCYRFLSGDNADYSGMAVACREQLIRDGVLSSSSVEADGALPTVISVLATANTGSSKTQVLTTYEQLRDMLIHLKSKGFANIYVKYKGTLSGGDNQRSISVAEFLHTLGTEEDLKELTDYMSAQNLTMFTDIDCITVPKGAGSNSDYAVNVSGDSVTVSETNGFSVTNDRNAVGFDMIEENVISLLHFAKENSLSAVSVSDAASFLYSDGEKTRDDIKNEISAEISSVSGTSRLMVEKGNLYALKNAEVVSDMPLSTSRNATSYYTSVPFYQLVLHGTLEYSCEPINLSSDYRKSILRAVEYGALPAFEWCYGEVQASTSVGGTSSEGETADAKSATDTANELYSYTEWANTAVAYYEKANKALGDLRDRRMTAHYKVKKNFYCTEYGDTKIYVNYTSNDVTVNGVTVPANDFMRIN